MSGIVAILHADGAPVDRQLVDRMTAAMTFRGPDAQDTWVEGAVGLGHALFRTTRESTDERQPFSLDGRVWIVADARVDDRDALIEALDGRFDRLDRADRTGLTRVPDVELLLRAYLIWGERCVEHLLGDFAFVVWDAPRRRLFAARDHFGVKPLFYARRGDCLLLGNTLDSLRCHPLVGDTLNEQAIGDFLLFGYNLDLATTVFQEIQRLPPAHTLTWSDRSLRTSRYWCLPVEEPLRYARPDDCVEQFGELLRVSVRDRLRTDSLAVSMSGGLDSTAIAATAVRQLRNGGSEPSVRAQCVVYDRLIPDDERHYARLAAEALGVPLEYFVADEYRLFEGWDRPGLKRPEPVNDPLLAVSADRFARLSASSRVMLYGEPADNLFWPATAADMLSGMPPGDVIRAVWRCWRTQKRRPPLGLGIQRRLKAWLGRMSAMVYPPWLNPEFEARAALRDRFELGVRPRPEVAHPTHPIAHRSLTESPVSAFIEGLDPGFTRIPLEFRYPFLDVRLVRFVLALPPIPWCVDKHLMRALMVGVLPEDVRRRPKTPLWASPCCALLRDPREHWVDRFRQVPELTPFVERRAIPKVAHEANVNVAWSNLLPLTLDHWMRTNLQTGNAHEG